MAETTMTETRMAATTMADTDVHRMASETASVASDAGGLAVSLAVLIASVLTLVTGFFVTVGIAMMSIAYLWRWLEPFLFGA